MLFMTYWFVFFGALTFPLFWLVPHRGFRLVLLAAACVVFHTHFAGPAGVVPVVVLGVVTYLAGLSRDKRACSVAMLLCVAALVFYKYVHFLCLDLLGAVWPAAGQYADYRVSAVLPEAPPLAISFFVFEFVHYLFDVRKGEEPVRNPLQFSLFALFWPSIVAGPVKRYQQFVPALAAGVGGVSRRDVAVGLMLLSCGLVKKCIADNLTAYLQCYTPLFPQLTLGSRWWLVGCMSFRILLDFSGYSDMAIGFTRMLGVRLPANFNWPYLASSLVDFWRRWHISLSTWIRDYIYIPIGGSRVGVARKMFNGVLAFAICGLWHGAALNFLVWGLYHGVGIAVASTYRTALGPVGRGISNWFAVNRAVAWALTMLYVSVGWVLFFHPLGDALRMIRLLFAW